jgi:hypothetical protein
MENKGRFNSNCIGVRGVTELSKKVKTEAKQTRRVVVRERAKRQPKCYKCDGFVAYLCTVFKKQNLYMHLAI